MFRSRRGIKDRRPRAVLRGARLLLPAKRPLANRKKGLDGLTCPNEIWVHQLERISFEEDNHVGVTLPHPLSLRDCPSSDHRTRGQTSNPRPLVIKLKIRPAARRDSRKRRTNAAWSYTLAKVCASS